MVLDEDEDTGDLSVRQVSEVSGETKDQNCPLTGLMARYLPFRIPPNCLDCHHVIFLGCNALLTSFRNRKMMLYGTTSTTCLILIMIPRKLWTKARRYFF